MLNISIIELGRKQHLDLPVPVKRCHLPDFPSLWIVIYLRHWFSRSLYGVMPSLELNEKKVVRNHPPFFV